MHFLQLLLRQWPNRPRFVVQNTTFATTKHGVRPAPDKSYQTSRIKRAASNKPKEPGQATAPTEQNEPHQTSRNSEGQATARTEQNEPHQMSRTTRVGESLVRQLLSGTCRAGTGFRSGAIPPLDPSRQPSCSSRIRRAIPTKSGRSGCASRSSRARASGKLSRRQITG